MIKTNQDLYKAVERLANELKTGGQSEWADKLTDAMGTSTLPGEILGEIRFQLRSLDKARIPDVPGDTIHNMLVYLDKVL